MRRILIFAVILLVSACTQIPSGTYDLYPRTGTVQSGQYAYSDNSGSWQINVHSAPFSTATPYPTYTPYPTQTKYPTYTPPASTEPPTPTQENTGTPIPTVSVTPTVTCELKINLSSGVKVRTGSSTLNAQVTVPPLVLAQGTNITVYRFAIGSPFFWAKISDTNERWVAVYNFNLSTPGLPHGWWADGSPDSERCVDVPGWNTTLTPPAPIASVAVAAIHAVPGANSGEMQQSWEVLRQANQPFWREVS